MILSQPAPFAAPARLPAILAAAAALAVLAAAPAWRTALGGALLPYALLGAAAVALVRRREAFDPARAAPRLAVLALPAGAVGIAVGTGGGIDGLAAAGALVLLFGATAGFAGGTRLLLPLGALAFAFPLPGRVAEAVESVLADGFAGIARLAAVLAGAGVERVGDVVVGDGIALAVTEECNGLGILVPMLFAAYLAAATGGGTIRQRLLVLAAAVPAALLLNAVRVAAVAVAAVLSPGIVEPLHDWLGYAAVAAAGLLPSLALPPRETAVAGGGGLASALAHSAGVALALGVLALLPAAGPPPAEAPLAERLAGGTFVAGPWHGVAGPAPERQRQILAADAAVRRDFRSLEDGRTVVLTAMAHARAEARPDRHDPARCFAALGWRVLDEGPVDGGEARWLLLGRGAGRQMVVALSAVDATGAAITVLAAWRARTADPAATREVTTLARTVLSGWTTAAAPGAGG